jgi:hypothetical protein
MRSAACLTRRPALPGSWPRCGRISTTPWSRAGEALEGSYGFPDPDDEHVIAAAVVGGAGTIVTVDKKFIDFDLPNGIEGQGPSEFAANTVRVNPTRARLAVQMIADRSGRTGPSQTPPLIVEQLEKRYLMIEAGDLLRES